MSNPLLSLLDIDYPLIQAPMAGVSTPALAAAVSNAGALGSLGLGASTVAQAEAMIVATPLVQLLRRRLTIPVVAAGGIMDGAGIASVMQLGAQGVQLGTAFLLCPESAADAGYRAAIHNSLDGRTVLTSAISGRPARCLANAFCALGEGYPASAVPDYPLAYDIGKALAAAAKAQGVHEYGAHWAGQGVGLIRECDAATLVRQLAAESGWN